MERDALALERDLAHHRVARLVPQLAAQLAAELERLVAAVGDDRRHPLGDVHLAQALVGERVRALVGGSILVVAVLVDQRRLVEDVGEARVAAHDAVARRRAGRGAQRRRRGRGASGRVAEDPAGGGEQRADRGGPVAVRRHRGRGRATPGDRALLVAQRRVDQPHRRVVGERVRGRAIGRQRAGERARTTTWPAASSSPVSRACASSSNTRGERRVGRVAGVDRRMAQLVDPALERGRVLGVEPDLAAERALDLPLGRAGERVDRDRVEPPVRVRDPPQAPGRAGDGVARARRVLVAEEPGERRDAHRSACAGPGVEQVQRVGRDGELDHLAGREAPPALDARGEARAVVGGEQRRVALLGRLVGGGRRLAGQLRGVDREDQVALGAEPLDHLQLRAQPRQRRVRVGAGRLEVGRPHAGDHLALGARAAVERDVDPRDPEPPAAALGGHEVHRRRAHERRDEHVRRLLEQALGRIALLDGPVAQHRDAVAERHRLDLVVRHVDGRDAEPLVQPRQLRAHADAQLGVEVGERLVHQVGLRLAHHRAADRDPLALAARERARLAVDQLAQPQHARHRSDLLAHRRLRRAAELEREREVVPHAHVRVERVVLEHHRHVAAARRELGDLAVADPDRSARHGLQPGDHPQQRRLPAAGRPDEDHELARRRPPGPRRRPRRRRRGTPCSRLRGRCRP